MRRAGAPGFGWRPEGDVGVAGHGHAEAAAAEARAVEATAEATTTEAHAVAEWRRDAHALVGVEGPAGDVGLVLGAPAWRVDWVAGGYAAVGRGGNFGLLVVLVLGGSWEGRTVASADLASAETSVVASAKAESAAIRHTHAVAEAVRGCEHCG